MTDGFWMRQALGLAQACVSRGEVPVGAIVTFENGIIGQGYNHRECAQDPTGHAEIMALKAASQKLASWRLTGCTLYVTLEPCLMCAGALVQARISKVVYAAKDPKAGALGSLYAFHQDQRLNHRFEVCQGIGAEESAELLRDFFRQRRRRT